MLQARTQTHRDQLSDAVSVTINNIPSGAAVVVAVQRGRTLQADRQVTGLAEESELLARVEGAEDGAAETTTRLQLLQTLDRVRRCALLSPAETPGRRRNEQSTAQSLD